MLEFQAKHLVVAMYELYSGIQQDTIDVLRSIRVSS